MKVVELVDDFERVGAIVIEYAGQAVQGFFSPASLLPLNAVPFFYCSEMAQNTSLYLFVAPHSNGGWIRK